MRVSQSLLTGHTLYVLDNLLVNVDLPYLLEINYIYFRLCSVSSKLT